MAIVRAGLWLSNKLLVDVGAGLTASIFTWVVLASPSHACEFFSVPQRFNTQVSEEVIIIGPQVGRPYQVLVLSEDPATLAEIRACVLDAFATQSSEGGVWSSRFGRYIQVGSFSRRSDAEVVGRVLNRSGYRARVTYRRQ